MSEALRNISDFPFQAFDIQVMIDDFINWEAGRSASMKTQQTYKTHLERFASFLDEQNISCPAESDVYAYKTSLQNDSSVSANTETQYIRTLKQFFSWAERKGYFANIAQDVEGEKIRKGIHKKDCLPREAVAQIASGIDTSTEQGKRIKAIYLLMISCGLREVEVSRANKSDISVLGGRCYLYVQGKGHSEKDTPVLLIPEVKEAIDDYQKSRTDKQESNSPLFVSTSNRSKGQRIAPQTISTMIKTLLIDSGYDSSRLTCHSLRHTSATGVYNATHDLFLTQQHQRHCDPKTTEIYLHANDRETRNTEQAVYDFYFKPEGLQDQEAKAIDLFRSLSPEKREKVLAYMMDLKA